MVHIDPSKPALVTGATGFVASWVIYELLKKGVPVHAAIRNPDDKAKTTHLDKLAAEFKGTIRYFKANLLQEGSYQEAMQGCELVFHTASPFTMDVNDPQKELIEPAVLGTQNILATANQTLSVKRVVLTSSAAAICTDAIDCQKGPSGRLNEDFWNTTASLTYQPYAFSKTLAEKKAWSMVCNQSRWDLVTINPSLVLGAMLNPRYTTSESVTILKQFGDGTMQVGVPKIGVGLVDVRDVARAHVLAGYTPTARGRYITSAYNTNFLDMASALQPKFGRNFPLPKRALPKWLLMIVGPLANKSFTRQFIRNNVDVPFSLDNAKLKRELKLTFLPLKTTMEDSFQVVVDARLLKSN